MRSKEAQLDPASKTSARLILNYFENTTYEQTQDWFQGLLHISNMPSSPENTVAFIG